MTVLQFVHLSPIYRQGFLGDWAINNPPISAGDTCSIPGSGSEDPLEKEMTTLSSIIWETPWTEEPGRLQSMGLQKSQKQFDK